MAKKAAQKPLTEDTKMKRISVVRFIYLYMIAAITFITFIIGAVGIVDTVMKNFVFHVEDYSYSQPVMYCEKFTMGKEGAYIDNPNYTECITSQEKAEKVQVKKFVSDETARSLSISIAQVLIAFPLWIFHWRIIERDRKEKKQVA